MLTTSTLKTSKRGAAALLPWVAGVALLLLSPAGAGAAPGDDTWIFGARVRLGWKYDDVRMCRATPKGAPHGPDIDIAAFAEVPLSDKASLDLNLPVMRPIMFALGARMVQFEPEVALLFRTEERGETQLVAGPTLGLSLHYGPDLNSASGAERGPSFWAAGPRLGGYVGVDFARPGATFNDQLGLHLYVSPLLSINDPEDHRGWVVGITLDNSFRFRSEP